MHSLVSVIPLVAVILLVMTYRPRRKDLQAPFRCPDCHSPLPPLREPTNSQQFRGGWTCDACGAELDRLARKIER